MFGGRDAGGRSLRARWVECEIQVVLGVQRGQGNEVGEIRVPVLVQAQGRAAESQRLERQVGFRSATVRSGQGHGLQRLRR